MTGDFVWIRKNTPACIKIKFSPIHSFCHERMHNALQKFYDDMQSFYDAIYDNTSGVISVKLQEYDSENETEYMSIMTYHWPGQE